MSRFVVLDTSAFYNDPLLTRPSALAFLETCRAGGWQVAIPAIVLVEQVGQYPEKARKAIAEANRLRRDLSALGLRTFDAIPESVPDYESLLRERLADAGIEVLPDPPITIADLGRRAARREKPFKDNAAGVQDTLLWLSVMTLATDASEVLLITRNTRDFGDGKEPIGLHSDLQAQAAERGLGVDRIRLATELSDVPGRPVGLKDTVMRIVQAPASHARLIESLRELLAATEIPQAGLELGVPLDNDPQPTGLDVNSVEVNSASQLEDGNYLVELGIVAVLILDVLIFRGDLLALESNSMIEVIDWNWNDHYVLAETTLEVELSVQVVMEADGTATDLDVIDVARPGVGPR